MKFLSIKWLLILGSASAWTIFFSLFNTPGLRGWRNLGWVACFVLGIVMFFVQHWRVALGTWVTAGVFSGLVYFSYELFAYAKAQDKAMASKPNPVVVVHGLALWPIMLPEAVEYLLAEVSILKPPEVKPQERANPGNPG